MTWMTTFSEDTSAIVYDDLPTTKKAWNKQLKINEETKA